jgi:hypothetical protein
MQTSYLSVVRSHLRRKADAFPLSFALHLTGDRNRPTTAHRYPQLRLRTACACFYPDRDKRTLKDVEAMAESGAAEMEMIQ